MARSIRFYKDILGLPIKTKSSDWVEFFARDTTLALHPIKSKRKNIKPSTIGMLVGFMVSDLESTAKTLKEKKVKFFKEPKNESFGKHAIIKDPDGHMISIAEMKSKAADEFDLLGLLGAE
jgi:predicted enzyme related to lactoylglutathione lyase